MEQTNQPITELKRTDWLAYFGRTWRQGQHVVMIGETGSGKTTLVRDMAAARDYVAVLAIKPHDDTLSTFRKLGYRIIKQWPPDLGHRRVVVWFKPENISDAGKQSDKAYEFINEIYKAGGWCLVLDDTGYVASHMGLRRALVILLSQGRSSHISVVCVLVQPTSFSARVPSEVTRQVRHVIAFKYDNQTDIKSIAGITGTDWRGLEAMMRQLGRHEFLAYERGRGWLLVRG